MLIDELLWRCVFSILSWYQLQSSAVITRSNIIRHYKNNDRNKAEYPSAGSTKDNPYLALTGKLWGVFCENL